MDELLTVRGLEVTYYTDRQALKALHEVSLDVRPKEIVGVVGESGCGKSTVAASIMGQLPANGRVTGGQVRFQGRDLLKLDQEALRRLRGSEISMVFQNAMTSLNPVFTVGAQMVDIQLAHQDRDGANRAELRHRAIEMLARVGVPDPHERIDHYPYQFSGGLRQRIMIAMALMSTPALLVADEPTSALDVTLEAQILELVNQLVAERGTAVLYISHDLGIIAQLCDRVLVMYAGRVVEQGDVYSLFDKPLHPYTQALLASVPSRLQHGVRLATIPGRVPSLSTLPPGCKFADRCPMAQPLCSRQEPGQQVHDGRLVRCFAYDPASGFDRATWSASPAISPERARAGNITRNGGSMEETLVKVSQLSTHFVQPYSLMDRLRGRKWGKVLAVDRVDLEIKKGEIIGLVGESGCGKTTLGKTILRLVSPSSGHIYFAGLDIGRLSQGEVRPLRGRMQMIFQEPTASLSPRLRVSYLLTEPYKIHGTPQSERIPVSQLLDMVGLSHEQAPKFPHQMSGGQARRVGIARALALHPEFIVADEPTSGLDVSVAASIINLMKDLGDELGLTYLIISHNLNMVAYIADRTAVMYLGNLVEVGPTARLFEARAHPYTEALLSAISEPDPRARVTGRRVILEGEIPSPRNPPPGCRFHTRCRYRVDECTRAVPPLMEIEPGHLVACFRWEEIWKPTT